MQIKRNANPVDPDLRVAFTLVEAGRYRPQRNLLVRAAHVYATLQAPTLKPEADTGPTVYSALGWPEGDAELLFKPRQGEHLRPHLTGSYVSDGLVVQPTGGSQRPVAALAPSRLEGEGDVASHVGLTWGPSHQPASGPVVWICCEINGSGLSPGHVSKVLDTPVGIWHTAYYFRHLSPRARGVARIPGGHPKQRRLIGAQEIEQPGVRVAPPSPLRGIRDGRRGHG